MNELSLQKFRRYIALICLMIVHNVSVAQGDEQPGAFELRVYYSDLFLVMSHYEVDDVPFQKKRVKVQRSESLLAFAHRNRFAELDAVHLAAAIYDVNPAVFSSESAGVLSAGTTVTMPTVGDIVYSQQRFENLKVAGGNFDFSSNENQMISGLRLPFESTQIALATDTKTLMGNQLVTLSNTTIESTAVDESIRISVVEKPEAQVVAAGPPAVEPKILNTPAETESTVGLVADNADVGDAAAATVQVTVSPVSVLSTKPSKSGGSPQKQLLAKDSDEQTVAATLAEQPGTQTQEVVADREESTKANKQDPVQQISASVEAVKPGADQPGKASVDTVAASAAPVIADNAESDAGFYLGPPQGSAVAALRVFTADPMGSVIEWQFDEKMTVGEVLAKLAEYVGYELISTDDTILQTYTRRLPMMQREISGITAEDGFLMLAGRGLVTGFDHVTRTIKHTPKEVARPAQVAAAAKQPAVAKVSSVPVPVSRVVPAVARISPVYEQLAQIAGVASMLKQFPADISRAATQHASRCSSTVSTRLPGIDRLHRRVVGRLQQEAAEPVVRDVLNWYKSPIGRKVMKLAEQQIDEAGLQEFSIPRRRAERIEQIYENTLTGKSITRFAVELDHAGWLLSGCRHQAESAGDVQRINEELILGQGIKTKMAKLESILKEDMLQLLAYQLEVLSDQELTEYADFITGHAGVNAELETSMVDAIAVETTAIALSSID